MNTTFALDGHATSQRNDAAVPVCSCIALLFLRLAEGGKRLLLFTNECDSIKHATKQSLRSSAPQSPLEDGEGKGLGSCGSLRSTRRAARVSGLLLEECIFVKARVPGPLLEECISAKARVSGLLLEECIFVKAHVSK